MHGGVEVWKARPLDELEKELSTLKVMHDVLRSVVVVVVVVTLLFCSRPEFLLAQSFNVPDRNAFITQPSGIDKRDLSLEKNARGKGGVKFWMDRPTNGFEKDAGVEKKTTVGSNSRSLRSPSRVMQALVEDSEEWRQVQVEETPESLNRRGQPGVTRMKHGAQVMVMEVVVGGRGGCNCYMMMITAVMMREVFESFV